MNDAGGGIVNVLAVHTATQSPLGADTWVHARILATLDRSTHRLHAACVPEREGAPTPTFTELSAIEDLSPLAVNLGPERMVMSTPSRLRRLWETLPAIPSVVRLARYIRKHDIDVIHTSDRPRDALVCVLLGKVTRTKSIVHLHVLHNDWMGRMLRWAIANADARVAVSEFVRSTLESADPGLRRSYAVLNAIDPSQWSPVSADVAARTRTALGVAADAPMLLTVCRLFEEKGVRRLVHALADVRQRFPDTHLFVAGVDHTPGEPHLRQLREDVDQFGLDDHVHFLGRRDDIPALMGAADIFAMPSLDEPFGLVFAEAMATELPVIALDNGGTKEVVDDGVHGLLSAPDDHDALVANVVELIGAPERRREMGRAGRAHVEANFSLERQAIQMAAVYRLILSQSPSDD